MSAPARWKHVMVDIETMGTSHQAVVLAVGLVPFQLNQEQCEVAPRELWWEGRLSLAANLDAQRHVDGPTVEWWLRQSEAARSALVAEPRFSEAREFCQELEGRLRYSSVLDQQELRVWAKPPQFDLEILRSLLDRYRIEWPAQMRLERDSRPLIDLAKTAGWSECFPECELEHGALADASEQAEQVVRIWRRVMGWK